MRLVLTSVLICGVLLRTGAMPDGAPVCDVDPGHGEDFKDGTLTAEALGNGKYKIKTEDTFKGIVINASVKGSWTSVEKSAFKVLEENCITHTGRKAKEGAEFEFTTDEETDDPVEFSGYMVYDYDSYSSISAVA